MTGPAVSVVVPTFNSARFLRECLDSIFAQTLTDYEVIVVDNNSNDGTLEIIRSYGSRVKLLKSEQNVLPGVTRNMGMKAAAGRYVAFLDSDDAWYPEKLAVQVAFMDEHQDVAMCHTYCHIMDEDSRVLGVRHEGSIPSTGRCLPQLLRHCFITTSSILVRRSVTEAGHILFPCDPEKDLAGEDGLFFLLVARDNPVGFIDRPLTKYRRYAQSRSGRMGWRTFPQDVLWNENVLCSSVYWAGAVSRREPLAAFTEACLDNCCYWREQHRPARAAFFALRALRRDLFCVPAWAGLAKSLLMSLSPR